MLNKIPHVLKPNQKHKNIPTKQDIYIINDGSAHIKIPKGYVCTITI